MKKFCCFLLAIGACSVVQAQSTPVYPVETLNTFSGATTVTGPFELFSPYNGLGPVVVYNTAQVDFKAGERVVLQPGFQAGNFQGNGYFHAQITTTPAFDVVFMEPNQSYPQVGQFEKLEIGIKLPAQLEQQVADFIANPTTGINPFDPDQISVEAHFTQGNTDARVYGFYFQDYERDPNAFGNYLASTVQQGYSHPEHVADWLEVTTDYKWRIRFAPPLTGQWNCRIEIHLGNSTTPSHTVNNIVFGCVPSSNQGWLKKGNDDWHLAYSGSNNSFFALGQNIGWPDNDDNGNACFRGGPSYSDYSGPIHGGYLDILDWIENLHANGGNIIRISNVPWSYELEYDQLDNYSSRLDRAWELDQIFSQCEETDMKISIAMHDKRFSNDNTSPFAWNANPYKTELGLNSKLEFFTNSSARENFKKKLRYFLARWGYSSSLGIFSLMGEMTGGFTSSSSSTWSSDLSEIKNWNSIMLVELEHQIQYRPLLTTTSYADNIPDAQEDNVFDLVGCSITSEHSYHNERSVNKMRFDEFNQVLFNRGTHRRWSDKPTYFEEMGLHELTGSTDVGDEEGCNDISYHNALWATSFMGGFGTGFVWWQWFNNTYREDNYPALHTFFSGVDFQNTTFTDPEFWDDAPNIDVNHSTSQLETYYIRSSSAEHIMGWVHNCTYWWGNISSSCLDRRGLTMPSQADDDQYTSVPEIPPSQDDYLITHAVALANYTFEYYSTRGQGQTLLTEVLPASIIGRIRPHYLSEYSDYAFKANISGEPFRMSNAITTDTLQCDEDTTWVFGNYKGNTDVNLSYHWDFGNGVISNKQETYVRYNAGIYLVTLIVSDNTGWSDTLRQYLYKPDPCNSNQRITKPDDTSYTWILYPNPANQTISILNNSGRYSNSILKIVDMHGQCLMEMTLDENQSDIFVGNLSPGLYLVGVLTDNNWEFKKLFVAR